MVYVRQTVTSPPREGEPSGTCLATLYRRIFTAETNTCDEDSDLACHGMALVELVSDIESFEVPDAPVFHVAIVCKQYQARVGDLA